MATTDAVDFGGVAVAVEEIVVAPLLEEDGDSATMREDTSSCSSTCFGDSLFSNTASFVAASENCCFSSTERNPHRLLIS